MRSDKPDSPGGYFPITLWSTILQSKGGDEAALDRLLARYRGPIIKEIQDRLRGRLPRCYEDVEDLAHDFILNWLRRDFLQNVSPERGRFRTFVKDCIGRFLIDVSRRRQEVPTVPIESTGAGGDDEHRPDNTPDRREPGISTLDREWLNKAEAGAMERLEREWTEGGRKPYFDSFRMRLTDDLNDNSYAQIAAQLGVNEGAVRVAHHRLRKGLVECLKQEVKETTASEKDFEQEWKAICELAQG